MTNIAVLDDWQEIALKSADWEALKARGQVASSSTRRLPWRMTPRRGCGISRW